MVQIIEQTDEEKMAMYMKLSKEELAKMLIEANKHIKRMGPIIVYPNYPTFPFNPYSPITVYQNTSRANFID